MPNIIWFYLLKYEDCLLFSVFSDSKLNIVAFFESCSEKTSDLKTKLWRVILTINIDLTVKWVQVMQDFWFFLIKEENLSDQYSDTNMKLNPSNQFKYNVIRFCASLFWQLVSGCSEHNFWLILEVVCVL